MLEHELVTAESPAGLVLETTTLQLPRLLMPLFISCGNLVDIVRCPCTLESSCSYWWLRYRDENILKINKNNPTGNCSAYLYSNTSRC